MAIGQTMSRVAALAGRPFRVLQQAPITTLPVVIGICGALTGMTVAVIAPFWWSLIVVGIFVVLEIVVLWFRVPVIERIPAAMSRILWAILIAVAVSAFLWVPMNNKYEKEYPPRSIAYVVPGFWSPAPSPGWFMAIKHCGPEAVYNVEIRFTDEDRRKRIETRGTATPAEIIESAITLHFEEIDQTEGGSAKLFPWTPLNADEETYTIRIVSRRSVVDESLRIQRVEGKWHYEMTISDPTKTPPVKVIDCRDPGFTAPSTSEHLPACFPRYVSGEHLGSCG
jgi:energy-coupling factor transporter transmembrane protein EcfT